MNAFTDLPQTPFGALSKSVRNCSDAMLTLIIEWERTNEFDGKALRVLVNQMDQAAFDAIEEHGISKEGFRHEAERVPGDTEFWILGQCVECGWRVAVPGEGMHFPDCPKCHEPTTPVLPQRQGEGFGDSLGALARIMPEGDALAAVGRGAQVELVVGDEAN